MRSGLLASLAVPALFLAAFPLSACGAHQGDPSTPTTSAEAPAPQTGRHGDLVGRWSPTLPPREARAVVMGRALLANPPNQASFEAIGPTAYERESFEKLLKLRATDDNGPILTKLRRKLREFEAMLVEITPASIGWGTADGAPDVGQAYRVLAEDGDNVTLGVKDEQIDVRVLDKDHISMRTATRTFLLTRDTAIGGDAASAQAAWNGATGRPGRDGGPRAGSGAATGTRDGSVIPGPGAPPAVPGAARDACTAYADCIDQMPRFSNDGGGMNASSSTIRSWEKTPERLRQCASAHEMARVATLCR